MGFYGRFVAAGYDEFMGRAERIVLSRYRNELLPRIGGRVLELGAGTGANVPYYPETIEELVLTEPEEPMVSKLRERLAASSLSATVVCAPAEALPFHDGAFDCVVSTLVLCTVRDLARALAEIHRVLKPKGRLLFIEHVRSEDARLARWQDRFDWFWVRIGHGCHCNRTTLEALRDSGLSVVDLDRDEMRGILPLVRPLLVGSAERI